MFVDGERFCDDDFLACKLGLDSAQQHSLAAADQPGNHRKPAGLYGRRDFAKDLAMMIGLKGSGALERPLQTEVDLHILQHFRISPLRGRTVRAPS